MKIEVNILQAFSKNGTGGNPAGVVFNAERFSPAEKQAIASGLGLPETAFVSPSEVAAYKLEFFTPLKQIAHCGHATVAAFSFLRQRGLVSGDQSSKETIDGIRNIFFRGDAAYMQQKTPLTTVPTAALDRILASVNLRPEDLRHGLQPAIVNTGNAFLILPLRSEAVLSGIHCDKAAVSSISEELGLIGYYAYAIPSDGSVYDATTRMFAPFYGIDEEAGTGMAAGPLAAFLFEAEKQHKTAFVFEQGRFMTEPSPSQIHVELELTGATIGSLYAGGRAYQSDIRTISI